VAKDKFGAAGDAIGKPTITEEDAARIDSATAEPGPKGPDGEEQVILKLSDQQKALTLRNVSGKWRLLISDFAGAEPARIGEQTNLIQQMTKALTDTADDIAAGKYGASADAEAALQARLNETMIRTLRSTTRPATAPSTNP
jgi:hypothetical protein